MELISIIKITISLIVIVICIPMLIYSGKELRKINKELKEHRKKIDFNN